ncbi:MULTISPECIES: RidA family protein [unclassified Bradyrhizobium]|uniref:RidA family protein n=1 Tax=Bradyrhizobium sp. USDA 4541 TaxID=2817704 RepID=UPI0020A2F699|nr:RidA family protein [Bradyrhizobium sp. USDA 4541]MCP1851288.1 2-iminobutanoate/2-iminopropanoate deaminase [Bradyrhizobium sp. USDA 4541]
MKREVVRVEPISSWLERWKAPASPVTRAGNMVFVSGLPPFDPATGEFAAGASIERQSELVMEQLKQCLEAAGATLDNVMKCNVPARIFVCIPEWTGPFDVEIDCIAMV